MFNNTNNDDLIEEVTYGRCEANHREFKIVVGSHPELVSGSFHDLTLIMWIPGQALNNRDGNLSF